jgi:pyrroloquinoline quinone (PQQ) biosynthesis protein C
MVNGLSASFEDRRMKSATSIVEEFDSIDVPAHPLFVRLRTGPVDLEALWILVANTNAGISPNFVRWLAHAIARMPDARIASLLAKQLDDELGNGNPDRIHRVLLERFVAGLEPWSPRNAEHRRLSAGQRLAARASEVFDAGTPYEAVGSLMVTEIFAKKMDYCLGDEVRRQALIPDEALEWLHIHEVLEIEHAADSCELALLVPDEGPELADAWRGARALWSAMWGFLDDVLAAVNAAKSV